MTGERTGALHVVQVSLDERLLRPAEDEESLLRHLRYARLLEERAGPGSRLTSLVLCRDRSAAGLAAGPLRAVPVRDGLLGTRRVGRELARVHQDLPVNVITTQRIVREGRTALQTGALLNIPVVGQIHSDRVGGLRLGLRGGATRLARFAHLRVVSSQMRETLLRAGATVAISVIPVPVRLPDPDTPSGPIVSPTLLFAGRFSREKNLESWVRVAAIASREVPDLRLVVVGDGPERGALIRRLRGAGLLGQTELPGWVPNRRLGAFFRQGSVLLLTSHREGFGRVLVEAGLHGLPVVAPALAGPSDIVEHGLTGYLHDPRDVRGMAALVVQLLREPANARAMGEAARRLLRPRFDPDRLAAEWVDLLIAVARRQGGDTRRCGS